MSEGRTNPGGHRREIWSGVVALSSFLRTQEQTFGIVGRLKRGKEVTDIEVENILEQEK